MSNIFRAYDVRGVYPDELNEEISKKIAGATVKFLNAKKIVVGEDARVSSPALRKAVLEGATKAGCDVYYIGQCTTPLFYFTVNNLDVDGGIMVTASHNPPQYNGLKIVRKGSRPISEDTGLREIEKLINSEVSGGEEGNTKEASLKNDYIEFLLNTSKNISDKVSDIKIIIDASNGVTPLILNDLLPKTKLNVLPLYFEIDGTFPNHLSDTSREENLGDLKDKVIAEKADVGIAFDGDGDRMAVVDEKGNIVRADAISALIHDSFYKNEKVTHDSRFSKSVRDFFGNNSIPSKTGHSFVKEVMRNNQCAFGAELSGHFFFKEMNYADSAILAMLRFVEVLTKIDKPLSMIVEPFRKYFNSGEMNFEFKGDKNSLLRTLREKYSDGQISELDGIAVEYWDSPSIKLGTISDKTGNWWFNARFSNTEPLMRVVVEAETKNLLDEKVQEISNAIKIHQNQK